MKEKLEEVLMLLRYVPERQLFAVITGNCGTGKTTLLRKFSESIDKKHYKFLYISDSKLTLRNFYRYLLEQMGYEAKCYSGEAKRQLHREIEIMKGVQGIHPICVCDESAKSIHIIVQQILRMIKW